MGKYGTSLFKIIAVAVLAHLIQECKSTQDFDVKYLIPGRIYDSGPCDGYDKLMIYCYRGIRKNIFHVFQTVTFNLNISSDDYVLYRGLTKENVLKEFEAHRSWFRFKFYSWKPRNIFIEPFNSSCIGVETSKEHKAQLILIRVDTWKILQFSIGIFFFFTAPRLSNHPFLFYACGITFGVTSSFGLLLYVISKLIPKRNVVLGVMIGGGTIGMYLLQWIWDNFETILMSYQNYVIAYLIVTSVLSFGICYRYGPVTDRRTLSLIKWTIQLVSLILILFSSYMLEATFAAIVIIVTYYNFPVSWIYAVVTFWKRKFPPKPKLLSADEYHEVVTKETAVALDDLRQFCSSPECNQWKTILRLKDPRRFAEFIEGKSHLSDDELMRYEVCQVELNEKRWGSANGDITDDDDD